MRAASSSRHAHALRNAASADKDLQLSWLRLFAIELPWERTCHVGRTAHS